MESWFPGHADTDLYLQVVVIVWKDPRARQLTRSVADNYQIRFYLAGLPQPAFQLQNARIVMLDRKVPRLREWVHFDIPVEDHFREQWGVVPEGYEFLRVLFEARWDNRPPGAPVHADVYYDDLHFGDAISRVSGRSVR